MAAVEYNVYNEKTMSIVVNGEPETDQAEQFLKDKLCEQGLKGASVPTSSIARTDAIPWNFPRVSFSDAPSFPRPSAVVEVYAEWAGRCNSLLPLLKRLKLEKDYDPAVFVMLHCKAEEHEMLEEYRGMSMPHFLVFRNGVKKATVNGANMPLIEKYIVDYTPNVPEADDLEENPLYIRRKEEQAEAAARAQEELRAAAA